MDPVISGLLGVAMGVLVTVHVHRQDRRDRYLFVVIKEKLSVSQEAYRWSKKIRSVIHGETEVKSEILTECQEWFDKNCLWLPPNIRSDFEKVIFNVWTYRDLLLEYYRLKHEDQTEEAERRNNELKGHFSEIIGLPRRIEECVAVYYEIENRGYFNKIKSRWPFTRSK